MSKDEAIPALNQQEATRFVEIYRKTESRRLNSPTPEERAEMEQAARELDRLDPPDRS